MIKVAIFDDPPEGEIPARNRKSQSNISIGVFMPNEKKAYRAERYLQRI